jgi:hypothetical protein
MTAAASATPPAEPAQPEGQPLVRPLAVLVLPAAQAPPAEPELPEQDAAWPEHSVPAAQVEQA